MEVHDGADIHLQPLENLVWEQVDGPEGDLAPWEPCTEGGS